jgi:hypothetical protein
MSPDSTKVHDVEPTTWAGLLEALFAEDWDPGIRRYRSSFAYRGMVDASWHLETSLIRLGGSYVQLEKHLLRNFRKYADRDVVQRDSFWHWLAVAQHHGLPTRLLDWTYSPLVALHFATEDLAYKDKPGIVWCVRITDAQKMLPAPLKPALEREGSHVFTVDMLSRFEEPSVAVPAPTSSVPEPTIARTRLRDLDDFDNLADEPFAMFMEPPSIDDRIVNQFALFSVISSPTILMDEWLADQPAIYRRVIVPASLKWQVRDRLDQANITERVILPGLDGLSRWLKRHYSPGPSDPTVSPEAAEDAADPLVKVLG